MKLNIITAEPWQFIIDHPEKQKQGIYLYYKGVPYPRRVYFDKLNYPNFFLRALEGLGTVKKFIFSLTYLSNIVIPRTLNLKRYEAFLGKFYGLCWWELEEFYLKDDEWSVPVWEIGWMVKQFLQALGFGYGFCLGWSKVVMAILEYDNAYRYRVQDLLGEITHLDRSTLEYALRLYKIREGNLGAAEKIDQVGKVLKYLLFVPKFKKALEKAQEEIDFNKFKLDINDRYHVSYWRGYDFEGKDFDTRYQFFLDTHKGDFPPFKKREDPKITADFLTGK
jgi:hypothetical protein